MFYQNKKPQGFIIHKSTNQSKDPRTLSLQYPTDTISPSLFDIYYKTKQHLHAKNQKGISSENSHGQTSNSIKKDQQIHYNSDVYNQKRKEIIIYEQHKNQLFQHKKKDDSIKDRGVKLIQNKGMEENNLGGLNKSQQLLQNNTTNNSPVQVRQKLSRIEEFQVQNQGQLLKIGNIHGQFDLEKYGLLHKLLNKMIENTKKSQADLLKNLQTYIQFIQRYNFYQTKNFKMFQQRKIVIKNSLILQKKSIMAISFCLAIDKYQALKNYCSNVLKYCLENNLVIWNLLTYQNNQIVKNIIKQEKQYLLGKGLQFLRQNIEIIQQLIIKIIKCDPLFANQFNKIAQKYSNEGIQVEMYYLKTFFAFYLHAIKGNHKIYFMSTAPKPFITESSSHQYTLVIDFFSVFLNNSLSIKQQLKRQSLILRPYSTYFLNEMAKYFQIVSFCDYMPIQSNKLLNKIDEKNVIKHRLYKYQIDHVKKVKDVHKIGRNVDKLIMLDCLEDINNQNLIIVNRWKGQPNDAVLTELCSILAMISVKQLSARKSIQKIKDIKIANQNLGIKYITFNLNL